MAARPHPVLAMSDPVIVDPHGAPPLTFEHWVEVDGTTPGIPLLGLERVWRGLLLRVEFPQHFQPGVQACSLQRHSAERWTRTLDYGTRTLHDSVQVDPLAHRIEIQVDVDAHPGRLQARMTMQIERPVPGQVGVRFTYAVSSPEHRPDSPLAGMVQQAWRQADDDTVFRLRQLAASGVLDGTPH